MPPLDDDLATFIRGSLRSVWSLELLLLLRRQAPKTLSYPELVRELRASDAVVEVCAQQLETAGLVSREAGAAACRYAPATELLNSLCERLERAQKERPVAVMDAILFGSNERLRNFADAFRFKEKDE